MSVSTLRIVNEGLTILQVSTNRAPFMNGDKFYFKLASGTTLVLDRNQADMLRLYLTEQLK